MKGRTRITVFVCAAVCACAAVFVAGPVAAQVDAGLEPVGRTIALGGGDIRVIIARIIQVALGLAGTVLLVLIIYAGFMWMTSGGNEERVATAKRTLLNSVIGLAIILSAFAIAQFVITRLLGATTGAGGPGFEAQVTNRFGSFESGALGEGIVQSHYPPPGATEVARNTKIIITFKAPMDPASLISGGKLNPANVRIIPTRDIDGGGLAQTPAERFLIAVDAIDTDGKTFVFIPENYLGSPSERVSYTVSLAGGGNGVKKADGSPAFDGAFITGYRWEFETGTFIDTTPPKIVSLYPRDGGSNLPRNSVIQITFDEAVDPVVAAGTIPPFGNVTVTANGTAVPGIWEIGNQYRTVEFRAAERAGTNSCGNDVFVLPANANITVNAAAASLGADPPQSAFPYPYDGVADLAGNSMDGDASGSADGPPSDSVSWIFGTSAQIDLTPPTLALVSPAADSGGADLVKPVELTFSKPMSLVTLSNQTMQFTTRPSLPLWYYGQATNLTSGDVPVQTPADVVVRTRGEIVHQALAPSVGICSGGVRAGRECTVPADCAGGTCAITRFDYYPLVTSGAQDLNQNCFFPACGQDPSRPYCCPNASGEVSCSVPCTVGPGGGLTCTR